MNINIRYLYMVTISLFFLDITVLSLTISSIIYNQDFSSFYIYFQLSAISTTYNKPCPQPNAGCKDISIFLNTIAI